MYIGVICVQVGSSLYSSKGKPNSGHELVYQMFSVMIAIAQLNRNLLKYRLHWNFNYVNSNLLYLYILIDIAQYVILIKISSNFYMM